MDRTARSKKSCVKPCSTPRAAVVCSLKGFRRAKQSLCGSDVFVRYQKQLVDIVSQFPWKFAEEYTFFLPPIC